MNVKIRRLPAQNSGASMRTIASKRDRVVDCPDVGGHRF